MRAKLTLPGLNLVALVDAIDHPGIRWLPGHLDGCGANSQGFYILGWGSRHALFGLDADTAGVHTDAFDVVCRHLDLVILPDDQASNQVVVLVLMSQSGSKSYSRMIYVVL